MFKLLRKFRRDQSGATAIEYALIGAVIGIGILVGATALKGSLNDKLTGIATNLTDAN